MRLSMKAPSFRKLADSVRPKDLCAKSFRLDLQAAAFFMMREQMDCYCRIWAALLGTLRRLRQRKPYLEASITRFRADLNVAPVLFYDPLYGV